MGIRVFSTIEKMKYGKRMIQQGYTQKDAAEKIGVTEKTFGKWVKKYGWKSNVEAALYDNRAANSLQDFMMFVRDNYPERYLFTQKIYDHYQNTF